MGSSNYFDTRHIETPQDTSDELVTRQPKTSADQRSKETRKPGEPSPQVSAPKSGQLPAGYLLQDRYHIMGVIAVGGMGSVYKAQDLRFSKVTRLCAVKEMVNTASDAAVRNMILRNFERETNILATLNHPNIVQIYDCFTEGNRSYLVIEHVNGKDLEVILSETEGFLPEGQVVSWAIQVCEVLRYLHNHKPQPIIFRDIKPSNIMLDEHNRIKLVDFGIAKIFQSGKKGTMIGTEGYSPPEQYRGIAEPRVDIYALGATMHHLLSKQDPRLEPPFSFHERPIHDTNPSVSRELLDVINRALEYDINERYGSADEMQRALMSLRSAQGMRGTTASLNISSGSSDISALWRFACEDEIRSKPTVKDGIVYVGAYDNNLYAIDAESGEFLWKYPTEGGIASSPHVYKGYVFVGSSDQVLYAISAESGRIQWTCPTQDRIWSSPRAAFDHVFFGSDDQHLYAVNVHSGRVAWKYQTDGCVRSSPAVGEEAIYVGCEDGIVYAVNTGGELSWRFRARRGVTSSPALTDEMIYVGSQDRHIYGLDIRSGWLAWRYRTDGPVISSPAVSDGIVYAGSADGHLYALDAEGGRLVWRHATDDQVNSSPLVFKNAVYFGSVDGGFYSLDAKTGELRWRFQTDGPVISSPTAANDIVYIGSCDRYLYALPT